MSRQQNVFGDLGPPGARWLAFRFGYKVHQHTLVLTAAIHEFPTCTLKLSILNRPWPLNRLRVKTVYC